jgi:hypothetical protein
LLAAHDGSPSLATADALVALKRAGIEVIAVTGRNRAQGTEIMRLLNLQTFIGELGCVVQEGYGADAHVHYNLGAWEGLHTKSHTGSHAVTEGVKAPAVFASAYDRIAQSGIVEQLCAAFPHKLELHNPYEVTREVSVMLRGYIDKLHAERILAQASLPLYLLDNGVIHPHKHNLVDCPEIHIYHLMPRGVSKGSAVADDMARRGLMRGQALSVGDAIGDMPMGTHTAGYVLINGGAPEKVLEGYRASLCATDFAQSEHDTHAVSSSTTYADMFGFPVFLTHNKTADGWAEFASALLAAQGVTRGALV